jgi:hypothetical protein
MGASGSVHDVLADDPRFRPVVEHAHEVDVEGGSGHRDDLLELAIGLPPIQVCFGQRVGAGRAL